MLSQFSNRTIQLLKKQTKKLIIKGGKKRLTMELTCRKADLVSCSSDLRAPATMRPNATKVSTTPILRITTSRHRSVQRRRGQRKLFRYWDFFAGRGWTAQTPFSQASTGTSSLRVSLSVVTSSSLREVGAGRRGSVVSQCWKLRESDMLVGVGVSRVSAMTNQRFAPMTCHILVRGTALCKFVYGNDTVTPF